MTTKLLSEQRSPRCPLAPKNEPTSITLSGPRDRGFRTPDMDDWGKRFLQIRDIDAIHRKYNDEESPLLLPGVVEGARRLIRSLEIQGWPPPTCMTGTVDATICLEWHDPTGGERFISIDVLGIDQYETFTRYHDKPSTLEVEFF